jgi:acyl-[acyl-carrier-protein]-phospholipid O-acyltransferase / long-chain-fatty-acid--[acyl-carrier-protein] ligase
MRKSPAPAVTGWQSGFWSLMGTQFQNAFSDNALKQLISLILVVGATKGAGATFMAYGTAAFSAPFILFSMFGGWLADRFSKQQIMVNVKLAEMGIMLFAALALFVEGSSGLSLALKMTAVFMMGCHSAIFAPSKYGILPEILPHEKLSWGNGILELLTFIGIIAGTMAAGYFLSHVAPHSEWLAGVVLMVIAFGGWLLSRQITPTPAADLNCALRLNPLDDLWQQLKVMKQDRDLWRACWGNAGFFFVSSLVLNNLTVYGEEILKLSPKENSALTAFLALGIGIGSFVAGYASRGKIEYRLVPIGAVGLALSTIPMGMEGINASTFRICLASLGFTAGLFIVPISAVLQHRPPAASKGAVQGAVSFVSWVGILCSAGVLLINDSLHGVSCGQIFWFCGTCAIVTGAYSAISRGKFITAE